MKRTLKTFPAMLMALFLMMTFVPFHASAAETLNFLSYVIVDSSVDVIDGVAFTYNVVADAANPDSGNYKPTIAGITFNGSEELFSAVQSGDTITLNGGQKYAKKQVSFDFDASGLAAGAYEYTVTQSSSTDGVTVTDPATRRLVVDVGANGSVTYTWYNNTEKSTGFLSEYTPPEPPATYSLMFGKEVKGTGADTSKYFKFTLTLGGLTAGLIYPVNFDNADQNPSSYANPSNVSSATSSYDFYLKDGQYITIPDLPQGFTYTLTEQTETGYASASGISADDGLNSEAYSDPISNTSGVTTNVKTGFTNTYNSTVPTGVLLTVTPFVVGLLLFGALFLFMMARRRRRY